MERYSNHRTHQGKRCQGKTPIAAFNENLELAKRKFLDMNREQLAIAI